MYILNIIHNLHYYSAFEFLYYIFYCSAMLNIVRISEIRTFRNYTARVLQVIDLSRKSWPLTDVRRAVMQYLLDRTRKQWNAPRIIFRQLLTMQQHMHRLWICDVYPRACTACYFMHIASTLFEGNYIDFQITDALSK